MSALCSIETVFTDYLSNCTTNVTVYTDLQASTQYRWAIHDKFGNVYEGNANTDENGYLVIPVEDLPAGLLNSYAGSFVLQIYDSTCKPIKFKMASEYNAVKFHVKPGTFVKASLGCSFTCVGTVGAQATLIPFTDVASVTIDYTTLYDLYGNAPLIQVYHETSPGSGIYEKVTLEITETRVNGTLTQIDINNAGVISGYVIIGS